MTQNERDYLDNLVKDAVKIIENNEELFSFYKYLKKGVKSSTFDVYKGDSEDDVKSFIMFINLSQNIGLNFILKIYYENFKKTSDSISLALYNNIKNNLLNIEKIIIIQNTLLHYLTSVEDNKKLVEIVKKYYE